LQLDTVCCSVLQCVAVCCRVLQCVAVCCSVLQCVAVGYSGVPDGAGELMNIYRMHAYDSINESINMYVYKQGQTVG